MAKKKAAKKENNISVEFTTSKNFKKVTLTFTSDDPMGREDVLIGLFKTIEQLNIVEE